MTADPDPDGGLDGPESTDPDPADLGRRLYDAYDTGEPADPSALRGLDAATGYAVQEAFVSLRADDEGPPVGYKLGFTNEAVQREVGIDAPIHGRLFADTVDGGVDVAGLLVPRAEPEIVVRLGEPLAPDADREAVAAAVGGVRPAVEVVDSRVGTWELSPGGAIADNALGTGLVTGPERPLADVEPLADVAVTLHTPEGERTGRGAAVLGDPLDAVAWLSGTREAALPPGTLVSTGSLTNTVPLRAGDPVEAAFSGLGEVTVRP
jgi:2-keto-4-pentenoate hydratase